MKFLPTLFLSIALLGACTDSAQKNSGQKTAAAQSGAVKSTGVANIGGPFTLVNTAGEEVSQDILMGKPSLVYFGFSYCPDVCPTSLQKMGAIQSLVDPKAEALNYIFITVDPERDTPESLAPYIGSRSFPERLIGLTGSQEQIDQVLAAYRVYAQKVEDPESAAEYTFDHSDLMLLMDAKGQYADIFTHNDTAPAAAIRVKKLIKG